MFRNALDKRFGLSLTESLCLTLLGTSGVSTPTSMPEHLEKRKFIGRKPNPGDRRGAIRCAPIREPRPTSYSNRTLKVSTTAAQAELPASVPNSMEAR
jgi:hypothetical protein